MNRGAYWATVYGVAESDMTERLTFSVSGHGDNSLVSEWTTNLRLYHLPP